MRLLFVCLAARAAMHLSLRHYRRFEAAAALGDFAPADRHLSKGRKGNARVTRLLARAERLRPGMFLDLA